MEPFDLIRDISKDKKNIIRSDDEPDAIKKYLPFLTNKYLSYFPDATLFVNAMNQYWELPNLLQHDFLFYVLNKRGRFAKQAKKLVSEDVATVASYFSVNLHRAEEIIKFLSPEQLAELKEIRAEHE